MLEMSQISLLIACYNAAGTIERAVRSIRQEPLIGEIIVVDDGSQDETIDVLKSNIADDKLKIFQTGINLGPGAARNIGLAKVAFPWVAVLDADDYFLPDRLKKLTSCSTDADFIADDLYYCTNDTGKIKMRGMVERAGFIDLEFFVKNNITTTRKQRTELGFLKPLISMDFLNRYHIRYRENLRLGEDFAFYVDALFAGARFKIIDACGYVSIERTDSLSARHEISDLEYLCEFDHLNLKRKLSQPERAAFHQHLLDTKKRLRLRRFLFEKANDRYDGMLREFLWNHGSARHILAELLKAKIRPHRSE